MIGAVTLLAFVTVQRLAELSWARRNEARLRAAGAVETGAAHYPVIVVLHASWLAACWALGWDHPVQPLWLVLFVLLQLGRAWVLLTLKGRWTTRVFSLPGETLVKRGPYRLVSHPNYLVVALEIPTLPLALGLPVTAAAFGLANLAVLAWRIRAEDGAIRPKG
jgi:methyltransferase